MATPDHWHPLICIAACQAGAHVYVEKPVGHTILEGRAMVRAAREADRVVQVGTHRRLTPHGISAYKFLTSGGAGKIGMVRAFVAGAAGAGQPEAPTPNQNATRRSRLGHVVRTGSLSTLQPGHSSRRSGASSLTMPTARSAIGSTGPTRSCGFSAMISIPRASARSAGPLFESPMPPTRPPTPPCPMPPTRLDVHWEFDDCVATWEHHQYGGNNQEKARIGCYFYGSKGVCHVGWGEGWTFYPMKKNEPEIHEDPQLHQPGAQNVPELWADFIGAIEAWQTAYVRHRNRPSQHDTQPAGHPVMEAWPQRQVGRRARASARGTRRPTRCCVASTAIPGSTPKCEVPSSS